MRRVSLLFHDVYESDPRESGFRSPAADRYKLSVSAFEAQLDGLVELRTPLAPRSSWSEGGNRAPREPQGAPSLSRGVSRVPAVITVDDGGASYYTVIADRLEALGLRAHCFVSTDFIGERGFLTPEQIRELDGRGHTIGTHSASHPARFSALTTSDMRREWSDSRQRLEDIVDHAVTVGSVPGGYFSRAVAEAAAYAGLQTLYTSEPTTRPSMLDGLRVIGRFTIRRGHPSDMARRFASAAPWARCGAWVGWNVKALVKPVLGASYSRVADWILESNR
jgi:peptidoglycan/xylan/chitin deacetylase (PgdA/CDA1 family)